MRHDMEPVVIALPPERQPAGKSGRECYQTPRPRKLTAEQEDEIWRAAPGRSLRDLAADFGVSHETIRAVLRENRPSALSLPSTHQHVNTRELIEVA